MILDVVPYPHQITFTLHPPLTTQSPSLNSAISTHQNPITKKLTNYGFSTIEPISLTSNSLPNSLLSLLLFLPNNLPPSNQTTLTPLVSLYLLPKTKKNNSNKHKKHFPRTKTSKIIMKMSPMVKGAKSYEGEQFHKVGPTGWST